MTPREIKQAIEESLLAASNNLEALDSPEANELNEKLLACLVLLK